jgi:predicted RNase H-like nuclease (RuvC/YqgF family)
MENQPEKIYEQLKAENERLKATDSDTVKQYMEVNKDLEAQIERLEGIINELLQENEKLKKILIEFEEYVPIDIYSQAMIFNQIK